jgi:alpha/beta hydrolase fold
MTSLTPQRCHGSDERGEPRGGLLAELALRFGRHRVYARLRWPEPLTEPAPLVLLIADPGDPDEADALSGMLCGAATAVVLTLTPSSVRPAADGPDRSLEAAALGWAAEHAGDISGDPARLAIAGVRAGGGHAAWLAIDARVATWPHLCHQLLVHPSSRTPAGMPRQVADVAPATIVAPASPNSDGMRYAARLRSGGIGVDELHCARHVLPAADQLANFVRVLGTHRRAPVWDHRARSVPQLVAKSTPVIR